MSMVTSFDRTVREMLTITWPMVVICVLILSAIRITYLIKNKKEFIFYKELFYLFFLVYILCLFQIVTFDDVSGYGTGFNLSPFKEIFRYELWSRRFFKNVVGNVVLFIPFGIFSSMYTKIEKPHHSFFLILFSSITIEVTQLLIGRTFDIDDLFLNIIGGMIGFFIYFVINKISEKLPKAFKSNVFLNILSIMLLGLFLAYIWMVVF